MKKIIALILGIALIYSCSTSSDENSNSETNVGPVAPSNLTGTVASTTQINLSWTDNSTNETGFKIERKTGNGTYAVVGTTATNVTTFNNTGLTPNTSYTYRVYSNNADGNSPTSSNELNLNTTIVISSPTISTTAVSSITTTTAISGGTISNDGGASITARGICWGTSANPTIALSTKTINGSGIGSFISNINGLSMNTTYFVRAYATNSYGTFYGNNVNFYTSNPSSQSLTDIDGNNYLQVTICNQTWMQSNLNVSKYSDGTNIPFVSNVGAFDNLTTGAWCYYQNDTNHGIIYGKLYNWYAVAGVYDAASFSNPALRKKLAPTGWHIPSDNEWTTLTTCLGGESIAGGKMKETGTVHWSSPNTGATNSSGFTALPGLWIYLQSASNPTIGGEGGWWSSTEAFTASGWYRSVGAGSAQIIRNYKGKVAGYSVRCVKD